MASAVDEHIPLARPATGEAERAAIDRVLGSGRLVLGPENQRFEALLAAATGRRHALCVSSGTTALELAMWALELGPGDQVLVPAGGYPAAANAALRAGATPVLVDLDMDTWTMGPAGVRAALTPATRAAVSVDTLGVVAEVAPLEQACREAGIPVIDDAACSLGGGDSRGHRGGGYGALGTLSFHPRKVITTGEGGAVLCDDDALADTLRTLRNQGQRGSNQFARPGTNARMSELAAAMGCAQMARLEPMLRERRLLVQGYHARLQGLRERERLSWQVTPPGARPAHQTFAVLLADHPRLPDRDQVRGYLAESGIETQVAIHALHRLDSLRAAVPAGASFPAAEAVAARGLALPLYVGMRSAQLDRICDTLAEVLA